MKAHFCAAGRLRRNLAGLVRLLPDAQRGRTAADAARAADLAARTTSTAAPLPVREAERS